MNTVFAARVSRRTIANFLLRRRLGKDLGDRDRVGEPPDFRLPVAGHEQHARQKPCRAQVTDEPAAVGARHVVEPKRGGQTIVDEDDAFQAGRLARRQRDPASGAA